jgi:hypothetical protein
VNHSIDRRTCRRFEITLPVLFRWVDRIEHYDVGRTANVGMGGMFILTSKCPPVGARVELEFVVPAFDRVQRRLRIQFVGEVTRTETSGQVSGFAVAGRIDGGRQEGLLKDLPVELLAKQ